MAGPSKRASVFEDLPVALHPQLPKGDLLTCLSLTLETHGAVIHDQKRKINKSYPPGCYLIAPDGVTEDECCQKVLRSGGYVVTPQWVLASALISRRLPAYLYSTREDLPFRGLLFCLNGIGANKERVFGPLIEHLGGNWTMDVHPLCSHLLTEEDPLLPPEACTLIDGPKQTHDQATNELLNHLHAATFPSASDGTRRAALVSSDWLTDCCRQGKRLEERPPVKYSRQEDEGSDDEREQEPLGPLTGPTSGEQVSLETAGNGKDDALKGVKVALDWTVMGVERRKILKMLPKMGATVVDAGQERDVTVRAFGEGEVEGEEEGEVVGALWVSACWKEGKRVKVAGLEGVMEQALRPRKEREIEGCRRVVACISGFVSSTNPPRRLITYALQALGVCITGPMLQGYVTHLVCHSFDGGKYDSVKGSDRCHAVTASWVLDSLAAERLLPEAAYLDHPSTPALPSALPSPPAVAQAPVPEASGSASRSTPSPRPPSASASAAKATRGSPTPSETLLMSPPAPRPPSAVRKSLSGGKERTSPLPRLSVGSTGTVEEGRISVASTAIDGEEGATQTEEGEEGGSGRKSRRSSVMGTLVEGPEDEEGGGKRRRTTFGEATMVDEEGEAADGQKKGGRKSSILQLETQVDGPSECPPQETRRMSSLSTGGRQSGRLSWLERTQAQGAEDEEEIEEAEEGGSGKEGAGKGASKPHTDPSPQNAAGEEEEEEWQEETETVPMQVDHKKQQQQEEEEEEEEEDKRRQSVASETMVIDAPDAEEEEEEEEAIADMDVLELSAAEVEKEIKRGGGKKARGRGKRAQEPIDVTSGGESEEELVFDALEAKAEKPAPGKKSVGARGRGKAQKTPSADKSGGKAEKEPSETGKKATAKPVARRRGAASAPPPSSQDSDDEEEEKEKEEEEVVVKGRKGKQAAAKKQPPAEKEAQAEKPAPAEKRAPAEKQASAAKKRAAAKKQDPEKEEPPAEKEAPAKKGKTTAATTKAGKGAKAKPQAKAAGKTAKKAKDTSDEEEEEEEEEESEASEKEEEEEEEEKEAPSTGKGRGAKAGKGRVEKAEKDPEAKTGKGRGAGAKARAPLAETTVAAANKGNKKGSTPPTEDEDDGSKGPKEGGRKKGAAKPAAKSTAKPAAKTTDKPAAASSEGGKGKAGSAAQQKQKKRKAGAGEVDGSGYVFALGRPVKGEGLEVARMASIIEHLGGSVYEGGEEAFDESVTHVVVYGPLRRTVKFLAGCLAGKWLLRPEYLDACAEAEAFLPVEEYEWGTRGEKQDGAQALMCQKWRQAGGQPLKGWKVLLYENRAAPMQPPLSVMTTVLTAGGATILSADGGKAAFRPDLPATTIILSSPNVRPEPELKAWAAQGHVCLSTSFLLDSISSPTAPDPSRYLLFGSTPTAAVLKKLVFAPTQAEEQEEGEKQVAKGRKKGKTAR